MEAVPTPGMLYELVGHLPRGEMEPVGPMLAPTTPDGCLIDLLDISPTHAGPGACRAEMVVGRHHLNMRGVAQGGAVMALADAAAAWASYAAIPSGHFTTVEFSLSLLRPASEGTELVALVKPLHLGRRVLVLEISVVTAEGESESPLPLVARATCTQLVLS